MSVDVDCTQLQNAFAGTFHIPNAKAKTKLAISNIVRVCKKLYNVEISEI